MSLALSFSQRRTRRDSASPLRRHLPTANMAPTSDAWSPSSSVNPEPGRATVIFLSVRTATQGVQTLLKERIFLKSGSANTPEAFRATASGAATLEPVQIPIAHLLIGRVGNGSTCGSDRTRCNFCSQ